MNTCKQSISYKFEILSSRKTCPLSRQFKKSSIPMFLCLVVNSFIAVSSNKIFLYLWYFMFYMNKTTVNYTFIIMSIVEYLSSIVTLEYHWNFFGFQFLHQTVLLWFGLSCFIVIVRWWQSFFSWEGKFNSTDGVFSVLRFSPVKFFSMLEKLWMEKQSIVLYFDSLFLCGYLCVCVCILEGAVSVLNCGMWTFL